MDTEKTKKLVLDSLQKTPIVQVVCKQTGISRMTYYRWIKDDQKFKKAAEEAQSEGVKLINDLAESKLISNINEQNMTAIVYWLKNHHSTYKDRLEVTAKSNSEPLTAEQRAIIERALELSPLKFNPPQDDKIRSHISETCDSGSEDQTGSSS